MGCKGKHLFKNDNSKQYIFFRKKFCIKKAIQRNTEKVI
jgi:hypothetical protein